MESATGSADCRMHRPLWIKFALLLLAVASLALMSSFILRAFIIGEFRHFREGETEDRVYWVSADLEGCYEKHGGWNRGVIAEDAVWALMLGMETRVVDGEGRVVMDTATALDYLSPVRKARVRSMSGIDAARLSGEFVPYPLFVAGREIGRLEVRFLPFDKEELFVRRSNRFLILSSLLVGGLSVILSILFARKLTGPIRKLAAAAEAVRQGELKTRVDVSGEDEIAALSRTFNTMTKALEVNEALRRRLNANAAHELRTPLAAIRGELEGMLDGLIPITREQHQSLLDETGRLTRIVAGMEELVQAEASILTLKKEHIRLRPFLDGMHERYTPLSRSWDIALRLECAEQATAAADPDRLSQILVNLLGNALKATPAGGSVTILAENRGRDTAVAVIDTGCGIGEDELPFIFERFYRGSKGGLGLGLAIVKELVEAHGGRITVESEPERGSAFTVLLPRE